MTLMVGENWKLDKIVKIYTMMQRTQSVQGGDGIQGRESKIPDPEPKQRRLRLLCEWENCNAFIALMISPQPDYMHDGNR